MAMLTVLLTLLLHVSHGARGGHDDAATGIPETEWFAASHHMEELEEYCVQWKNPRVLFCLDLFSKSQRIARTFQKNGWASAAFDIATNPDEDILARDGFYRALDLALAFLDRKTIEHFFFNATFFLMF